MCDNKHDNKFEAKEKKIWTKDKIEPQHMSLTTKEAIPYETHSKLDKTVLDWRYIIQK